MAKDRTGQLEKKPSTRLSHQPCLGVKVNSTFPNESASYTILARPARSAYFAGARLNCGTHPLIAMIAILISILASVETSEEV